MIQLLHPFPWSGVTSGATPTPSPTPTPSVSMRRGTFADLPSDLGLYWYHAPNSSSVTLDANNNVASVENLLPTGSNPAFTQDPNARHFIKKVNGFDTFYSNDLNKNGILLSDISKMPFGNAKRHLTFVVMPLDGIIGGYRGDTSHIYCLDSPYNPGVRLYAENQNFTSPYSVDGSAGLLTVSLNHNGTRTTMTVDGHDAGYLDIILNTEKKAIGIKGAEESFYAMAGGTLSVYFGQRDATFEEQCKIDSAAQFFTGKALASNHPYATNPWMVPA